MSNYAVITSFPYDAWGVYARAMVESFVNKWPKKVPLFVQLDKGDNNHPVYADVLNILRKDKVGKYTDYIRNVISEDQERFLERHENFRAGPGADYRHDYVRFSHKIFALQEAAKYLTQDKGGKALGIDYLIWMDADIVTDKKVTVKQLDKWNGGKNDIALMQRKDWDHSECSLMFFNMKKKGRKIIDTAHEWYITDKVIAELEQWHDSYVLDRVIEDIGAKAHNITEGISGRDVFELSDPGKYMTHYKGNRKNELAGPAPVKEVAEDMVNLDNLVIQTKNCVPDDSICDNIKKNLSLIDNWLPIFSRNDEDIVICSAGPSLEAKDIIPWQEKGTKILAVKHAMDKLQSGGITPWACMLLDPRQHVEEFVRSPNKDVKYFVASMVDPSVTETLLDNGCQVYGYHALVGAGEDEIIPKSHFVVHGGSATATRSISLLEGMGFRTMHCYGYDCCYYKKPDLQETKENGNIKYQEITLELSSWENQKVARTIWTEGQFLAQINEFRMLLRETDRFKLHTYGEGVIPWVHKHDDLNAAWNVQMKERNDALYIDAPEVNSYFRTCEWLEKTHAEGQNKSSK